MNDEYIKKDDAIKVIENMHYRLQGNGLTYEFLLEHMRNVPSADVVERKRGEWIYKPDDYDESTWECSNCKEPWTLIDGTPQDNNMNFCPNCGADMRGDDNE